MTGPLPWLAATTALRRFRRRLARLREPARAVAALLAVGYLGAILAWGGGRAAAPPPASLVLAVGGAGLTLAALAVWLLGTAPPYALSAAESAWLLPAPLPLGRVLAHKAAQAQGILLLQALLWTLLTAPGRAGGARRAVAIALLLTVVALHRQLAATLRAAWRPHAAARDRRGATAAVGLLVALALLAASAIGPLAFLGPDGARLAAVAEHPAARAVLAPARFLLAPVVAATAAEWRAALPAALAVLLAHAAALACAVRRWPGATADLLLGGGARADIAGAADAPLWPLAPRGSLVGALLWRHVTAAARRRRLLLAAAAGVGLVALTAWCAERAPAAAAVLGAVGLVWGGFALVLGPQYVRADLRLDLDRLATLRAWPVPGAAHVAASAAATALLLGAGLLVLAAVAAAGLPAVRPPDARPAWAVAAALALAALAWLASLIQTAGAILYPEWVRGVPRRGVEALGAGLLGSAASAVAMAVLAALPSAAALLAWWFVVPTPAAPVVAALVAVLVTAGESVVVVGWLGRRFEGLEPGVGGG